MKRQFFFISAILAILTGSVVNALAAPPSAYEFVRPNAVDNVELSPNGRYLAYLVVRNNKYCFDKDGQMVPLDKGSCGEKYKRYRSTHQINVYDLETSKIIMTTPVPENLLIDWLEWASNDRLLGALRSPFTIGRKGKGHAFGASRIVSFPITGGKLTPLFQGKGSVVRQNRYMSRITNLLRSDPNHIIMPANRDGNLDLWKVNVLTGKVDLVEKGRADTFYWFTDSSGRPVLRFDCKNSRCRTVKVFSKPEGTSQWKLIKTFKRKPQEQTDDYDFWPIGPTDTPGQYYMISREDEAPRRSIRIYDLKTDTYTKTVFEDPNYDVGGAILYKQTGAYAGAWLIKDRVSYVMEDTKRQKHLAGLNTYFENKENVVPVGYNTAGTKLILFVSAPNNPGEYYLYNFKTRQVERLLTNLPNLGDRLETETEIIPITTRDGKTITAYHTRPTHPKTSDTPLIVMPHGGPEARDVYDYATWPQYFASRGYQVLQVNFRGSAGYGRAFAEAGYRQWGGRMQDDISDAVKHLYNTNIAKPDNTCIVGYSYGGYAAMMGAALTPDLYKCIVSGGAPSDLVDFLKRKKVDFGDDSAVYEYWEETLGELKADKDTITAVSPISLVNKFQDPVFLIHGEYDGIVHVSQSENMESALKKAGKTVEYFELEDAGHGGWSVETEILYLETIERFLAKHLTGGSPPPPAE